MPKLITIGYDEDLLREALRQIGGKTVLVFPTRSYAGFAERQHYRNWSFEDVQFISIDDLKTAKTLIERPELQEDKRLLCLYLALTAEDQEEFHIFGYQDIVSWGQHFFRFFEELAEEEISVDALDELCGSGILNLREWQERFLTRIYSIRGRYRQLISDKGFSDRIFNLCEANMAIDTEETRYIFVNQYYYTGYEKRLIRELEKAGNSVTIISQTESEPGGTEFPEIKSPDLYSLFDGSRYSTREVRIIETRTQEQMVLGLLASISTEQIADNRITPIVVNGFQRKAYSGSFDRELFNLGYGYSLEESFFHTFLEYVHRDLGAMFRSLERRYIPIRNIIVSFSDARMIRFLKVNPGDKQRIFDMLMKMTADDVLYIDKDLRIFAELYPKQDMSLLSEPLGRYLRILGLFTGVGSPEMLVELLTGADFDVRGLFSPEEIEYADSLEQFAERLENFLAIGTLGIVDDWALIFGKESGAIPCGLLRLFIDSAKTAKIHRRSKEPGKAMFEITDLLDSRNYRFPELIFLDVIEGLIPSSPEPVWLFNETQRKKIGLKAYEDVREWERYYFFRLLLGAEKVTIHTYANPEQDTEPSSFVSELLHLKEYGSVGDIDLVHEKREYTLRDYYLAKLGSGRDIPGDPADRGLDPGNRSSFFNLPFEPMIDLKGENIFKVSYYTADRLMKNPFVFYLEAVSGLREANWKAEETVTRKFFGTLVHDYLGKLLMRTKGENLVLEQVCAAFGEMKNIRDTLFSILDDNKYAYKLPQNYNREFIREIISDCITETVYWFFTAFLPSILPKSGFKIIPEEEEMTKAEKKHKQLLSGEETGVGYSLIIRGKADLRIESPERYTIIDFKTGRASENQLIFYEWVYYLLNGIEDAEIEGIFAKVLEQDHERMRFTDKDRQKLKEKLRESIIRVVREGYGLGLRSTDRQYLKEITRADLFVVKGGSDEQL